MTKTPLVSIIMPTYNRAYLIEETFSSILKQTYENWECIVIDDGSTDNTDAIVEALSKKDKRFKYRKREPKYTKGPSGCRNQGIDMAIGEYIVFFDSDDIIHPKALEICIEIINNTGVEFCRYSKKPFFGKFQYENHFNAISPGIKKVNTDSLADIITQKLPFACCCVMWHKDVFKNNLFNENLSYAEEWELYSRIISTGISGVSTNTILYFNRKHPNSSTGRFQKKDPEKIRSKILASESIIQTLSSKHLFSPALKKYFINLGFQLKSKKIIDQALLYSGSGTFEKLKYILGYWAYPVLRPLFILKGKLLAH